MKVRIDFDDGVDTVEFKTNCMNPHVKACVEALTQMMVKPLLKEEDRLWDVIFSECIDGGKIHCLKQVREVSGMSLKDAKHVVETRGKFISGVSRKRAEEIAKQFNGAINCIGKVNIVPHTEST